MTELEAIRRYWNTRAEGYSLKTAYDLQHAEKVWLERLRPFVLASGKLDILDIGCGPGFFSILLARLGHSVVAFDYTEGMLERASRNLTSLLLCGKATRRTFRFRMKRSI